MKSSELFRALRSVGPISVTLFMSDCSAALVGGCVSFDLESLVSNYLQVAWQRSQVDLLRVWRHICTLIWTTVSGAQPYALLFRYWAEALNWKRQTFLPLVPSLIKPNSIVKRKSANISNAPSALCKVPRHLGSLGSTAMSWEDAGYIMAAWPLLSYCWLWNAIVSAA